MAHVYRADVGQVIFFASDPVPEACDKLLALNKGPEEVRITGREVYIYFPNGQARPRLSWAAVDKILNKMPLTARNWNTVNKLLEIAESLEKSA